MDQNVIVNRSGQVLEIALNRPEKKNALTRSMYQTICTALAEADADKALRCVLLTGTGDTFTSGNDIKDFQTRSAGPKESSNSPFLDAISTFRKPLIAAVNGAAIGVGTTMLAHCDLVVAARSARF